MKFDAVVLAYSLEDISTLTRTVESLGFDGLWLGETNTDPFLSCTLIAEHSQNLTLGTGIAVAFARSPATLAYIAWDLARFSKGRFVMGLGPQVRAHNERRFGVKWEKPVLKMRETILAMRAFWDCWQNGTRR
jgi:alkanesulfonate monooxygenase SsuD/methylene tetrahydromethanopterin reductase-like flavin-dependent oxidoreductase (luciferase family)